MLTHPVWQNSQRVGMLQCTQPGFWCIVCHLEDLGRTVIGLQHVGLQCHHTQCKLSSIWRRISIIALLTSFACVPVHNACLQASLQCTYRRCETLTNGWDITLSRMECTGRQRLSSNIRIASVSSLSSSSSSCAPRGVRARPDAQVVIVEGALQLAAAESACIMPGSGIQML